MATEPRNVKDAVNWGLKSSFVAVMPNFVEVLKVCVCVCLTHVHTRSSRSQWLLHHSESKITSKWLFVTVHGTQGRTVTLEVRVWSDLSLLTSAKVKLLLHTHERTPVQRHNTLLCVTKKAGTSVRQHKYKWARVSLCVSTELWWGL